MRLTLYQIDPEQDYNRLMFMDLDRMQRKNGGRIPAEIYRVVFEGELDIHSLEDAFYIFNMRHPASYQGRSMSVSDVVELQGPDNETSFHYCCSVGFQQIEFDKSKAVPKNRLILHYKGRDDWDRPVYEASGRLYVDVNPRKGWPAKICTKYNNDFYGEPDTPISETIEVEFVPSRDLWD